MVDTPVPPPYPIVAGTNTVNVIPPATGMFTLRIYDSTGLLLAQTDPFSVSAHLPHTYTVSAADVASLVEATQATLHPANGVFDDLSLNDTATVSIRFAGVAADALTLTEAAANNGTLLIEEVITLTEDASANMNMTSSASDSLVLLEAPVGAISGGSGGLLNVTFKIKNTGTASIVKPKISIGHPFGPGDVPAGYKLALYDSTGVTQNTNFQQDQEAPWKQDGSLKFAALSFISPDTFTAGQVITYTLKAVAGVPNRTPNVTLSQLKTAMVSHDIAWNFYGVDLGTDTYKVSTQDVLTNFCPGPWNPILPTNATTAAGNNTLHFADTSNISVGLVVSGTNIPAGATVLAVTSTTATISSPATGTGVPNGTTVTFQYPLGGYFVVRSGPVCTEYCVWSFMRRTSDGAFHKFQRAKLFIRAWGVNGPFEVVTRLQRPNIYGGMPNATLGVDDRTAQYSYVSYGSQTAYTFGGANDPNNFTISPSQINVATSSVTLPWPPLKSPVFIGGPGLTFSSTGTLPGGIDPNRAYYLMELPLSNPGSATSRDWLFVWHRQVATEAISNPDNLIVWAPNKTVAAHQHIIQNGFIYRVYAKGTTAATGTGPTGNTAYQTDGTAQWWCVGSQITSQGTGTITANWTVGTWRNSGFAGATNTAQRIWIAGTSSDTQMQFTLEHDFDYLTTQSRAVPCFDPGLLDSVSYMGGPCYPNKPNTPFVNMSGGPYNQSATGDGPADERIGYINPSSANLLYTQLDPVSQQYAYSVALQCDDDFMSADDERAAQPVVANYGHNRSTTNPTTYPGLAPVNRSISFIVVGGVYGNPQWIQTGFGSNASGYGANYGQLVDAVHRPILWYVPYLRTGDYIYYDIGRAQAANMIASINSGYTRNLPSQSVTNPNSGNTNYGGLVTGPNQQARSWGWIVRAVGCAWHIMQPSDPLYPYIDDCLNDSAAYLDVIQVSYTQAQRNMGWVGIILATGGDDASELWMHSIMFLCAAMEAWRGERPQWGSFLKNYFVKQMPAVLDSAQGGCEAAADSQWFQVSDTGGANFGADFYQTPLEIWQATYPNENWTSATCTNHTGMLKGLSSGRNKWVPMVAPAPADGYWNMARSACAMGGVIGIDLCSQLAVRIATRVSQVGTISYIGTPGTSTVTNYVKWAIYEPETHS